MLGLCFCEYTDLSVDTLLEQANVHTAHCYGNAHTSYDIRAYVYIHKDPEGFRICAAGINRNFLRTFLFCLMGTKEPKNYCIDVTCSERAADHVSKPHVIC